MVKDGKLECKSTSRFYCAHEVSDLRISLLRRLFYWIHNETLITTCEWYYSERQSWSLQVLPMSSELLQIPSFFHLSNNWSFLWLRMVFSPARSSPVTAPKARRIPCVVRRASRGHVWCRGRTWLLTVARHGDRAAPRVSARWVRTTKLSFCSRCEMKVGHVFWE